jgi:predicted DNA binding protein
MYTSTIQACSILVHKFGVNVCSALNSSETESPTHSHIDNNNEIKNEEERKEEEQEYEMLMSSDISTSSKERIEPTMGNKILKTKDKMVNFTELTDQQVEMLVSSTNFSAQQVREWHQS